MIGCEWPAGREDRVHGDDGGARQHLGPALRQLLHADRRHGGGAQGQRGTRRPPVTLGGDRD
jgi:hypothetical protein